MDTDSRTPIGYVYKIYCTLPDVSGVYIGKTTRTIDQRFKQHCGKTGSRSQIGIAIQRYGAENFKVEELAIAYSQDELSNLERAFILAYDSIEHGFNVAKGGQGVVPSDRLRRKWQVSSYKNKPVVHYETGVQYISGSEAARALGLTTADITECCRLHLSQTKGHHFYYPDADLEKCKAFWISKGRRRPVMCVETGEIYKGIKEASDKTGISRFLIADMCKGKTSHTRSSVHFHFADISDEDIRKLKCKWESKIEYAWGKKIRNCKTGTIYSSLSEAAREAGISIKRLKRMIILHDTYEFVK